MVIHLPSDKIFEENSSYDFSTPNLLTDGFISYITIIIYIFYFYCFRFWWYRGTLGNAFLYVVIQP